MLCRWVDCGRLMALAICHHQLIRDGIVADQAELAHFDYITPSRMTQIMMLLILAPDIQEHILFHPHVERGRDPIKENDLRLITRTLDWRKQRRMWAELQRAVNGEQQSSR